jgi:hypothetical protein
MDQRLKDTLEQTAVIELTWFGKWLLKRPRVKKLLAKVGLAK